MQMGPPVVIKQETHTRSTDSDGILGDNQYIPLTVSGEAGGEDEDSEEEYEANEDDCEKGEETVEFKHQDEEELQALRGGGTSDSLFDANITWDESWEHDSKGKSEKSRVPLAEGDSDGQGSRPLNRKEERTDISETRDGNGNRAEVSMSRNAENAKEEEEAKLLDEVKVMEESDPRKLRKPTRQLWKYRKEDGVRLLLAGKKKIGTSPEKRFKRLPHKYRRILHRQRTKTQGSEVTKAKRVQWRTGGERIQFIQGEVSHKHSMKIPTVEANTKNDKPYSALLHGTSPQGQQGFTTNMIMKLINQSRVNGGKGKISNWIYDENTTTESGNRKKEARIEDRVIEGDKGEARGDCESDRVNGKNMDDTSPEREGTRRGRNAATEESKIDGKRSGDATKRKSTQTSIAESATVALTEDSQETNNEGHKGSEEPHAPGDGRNKRNETRP
jgi:hypothetical protein